MNFRRSCILALAVLIGYFDSFALAFAQSQCPGDGSTLCNPLNSNFSDIPSFIAGALKILVEVALPVITLFFVYAGFLFISAQGNVQKLNEAKKNFIFVILGALLILGAWIIATLIGGTVTQLTGGQ